MNGQKIVLYFIFFVCSSIQLLSQPVFEVKVNSSKITINQYLTVTYTLKGGRSQAFERPAFENFQIVGQRNATGGGSFQIWINNQRIDMSDEGASETWSFTLMPTKTGTFTIPPARVKVNNKWISSESLTITVTAEESRANTQHQQSPQQIGQVQKSPQTQQQSRTAADDTPASGHNDVFIRAIANKQSAYVGEPIVITYKLYTRIPVLQYVIDKTPSFDGFWSENLMSPQAKPQQSEEIINGERYATAVVRKIVLYPQRAGTFTIDPMEMKTLVRLAVQQKRQSSFDYWDKLLRDFFNDPFFNDPFFSNPFSQLRTTYRDEERTLRSNKINLRVLELPSKNRTVSFTGQVGQYSMDVVIDKNRLLVDEAFRLQVKISGNGNLNLLEPPQIEFPEQFEVFEPETQSNMRTTADGLAGEKIFTWTIIPRAGGKYIIPPIEFTYFDPRKADYVPIRSQEFEIHVIGEEGGVQQVVYGKKQTTDIRFIRHQLPTFMKTGAYLFGSPVHISLLILPFLMLLAFIGIMRRHIALQSNPQLVRYRAATRQATRRLKKAQNLLKRKATEEFYAEIANALWNYFADRFFIERSQLATDTIESTLKQQNISDELIQKISNTLQVSEMVRFAPSAITTSPEQLLADARTIIETIEKTIPKNYKA